MTTDCKHAHIQTWRFEDSAEVAGMWSCTDCGRRFEPVAPVADHACTTSAVVDRVPLTDDQINAVTRQQWGEQLGSAMMAHRAYARAIEAAAIANVDLTQLTTRGAVAWAGVDPQALREGG